MFDTSVMPSDSVSASNSLASSSSPSLEYIRAEASLALLKAFPPSDSGLSAVVGRLSASGADIHFLRDLVTKCVDNHRDLVRAYQDGINVARALISPSLSEQSSSLPAASCSEVVKEVAVDASTSSSSSSSSSVRPRRVRKQRRFPGYFPPLTESEMSTLHSRVGTKPFFSEYQSLHAKYSRGVSNGTSFSIHEFGFRGSSCASSNLAPRSPGRCYLLFVANGHKTRAREMFGVSPTVAEILSAPAYMFSVSALFSVRVTNVGLSHACAGHTGDYSFSSFLARYLQLFAKYMTVASSSWDGTLLQAFTSRADFHLLYRACTLTVARDIRLGETYGADLNGNGGGFEPEVAPSAQVALTYGTVPTLSPLDVTSRSLGYCYLDMFRISSRDVAASELVTFPTFTTLLNQPASRILSFSELSSMCLTRDRHVWHLHPSFAPKSVPLLDALVQFSSRFSFLPGTFGHSLTFVDPVSLSFVVEVVGDYDLIGASSSSVGTDPPVLVPMTPTLHAVVRYYSRFTTDFCYNLILSGARHSGYWPSPAPFISLSFTSALRRMERYLISRLGLSSGSAVIDMGAGSGFVAVTAALSGLRVLAVDLTPSHLLQMLRVLESSGAGSAVTTLYADFHDLSAVPAASVDGVYFMESFIHSFYKELLLAEVFRVLKPGGVLVIHDYEVAVGSKLHFAIINTPSLHHCADVCDFGFHEVLLRGAGFVDVDCHDLTVSIYPMWRVFYFISLVPYFILWLFRLHTLFPDLYAAHAVGIAIGPGRYVSVRGYKRS